MVSFLPSDQPAVRDRRAKDSPAELMRSGYKLRRKRPTEFLAIKHWREPNSPDFAPPAEMPSKLFCCKCRERKPHEAFGKDERYVNRWGRRTECHSCWAKMMRETRLKQRQERKQAAKAGL